MNGSKTAASLRGASAAAGRQARPWAEKAARFGYAAKGVIYLIIGILAVEAALGHGNNATNTQGAMLAILQQPFGRLLLGIVAVGLAAYALWRLADAAFDLEDVGRRKGGAVKRVGYAISGLIYGFLAYSAFRLLSGATVSRGHAATQNGVTRLLALPSGQWITGLLGVIIICVGLFGLNTAFRASFLNQMQLPMAHAKWPVILGRFGYAARGIIFGVIGGYLIDAAVTFSPQRAKGLQGAQTALAGQPGGAWLFLLVAVGLAAYGLFMFVEARYHRISID